MVETKNLSLGQCHFAQNRAPGDVFGEMLPEKLE